MWVKLIQDKCTACSTATTAATTQCSGFQDVLTSHDCLKRSTNLPLFHTDKTKDTTTGWWLIEQVDVAANIATWDGWQQVQELACILRGQAKSWRDSLETSGTDKASWNAVKASFLCTFEHKYSAKTICANLQDLVQKPGEVVFPTLPGTSSHWKDSWPASPIRCPRPPKQMLPANKSMTTLWSTLGNSFRPRCSSPDSMSPSAMR